MHVHSDVEIDVDKMISCWILPTENVKKVFVFLVFFFFYKSLTITQFYSSIGTPFSILLDKKIIAKQIGSKLRSAYQTVGCFCLFLTAISIMVSRAWISSILKKLLTVILTKISRAFELGTFESVVWWFIILFTEPRCYTNHLFFKLWNRHAWWWLTCVEDF